MKSDKRRMSKRPGNSSLICYPITFHDKTCLWGRPYESFSFGSFLCQCEGHFVTCGSKFSLDPNYHVFAVDKLDENSQCVTDRDRTVRFKYYENDYLERLSKLTMKIYSPEEGQTQRKVELLGVTPTKPAAVFIKFLPTMLPLPPFKQTWNDKVFPKHAYFLFLKTQLV